jgi:hypothetical protein
MAKDVTFPRCPISADDVRYEFSLELLSESARLQRPGDHKHSFVLLLAYAFYRWKLLGLRNQWKRAGKGIAIA